MATLPKLSEKFQKMNDNFKTWEEAVLWLRSQETHQELVKSAFYDDPLIDAVKRYADSCEWRAVEGLLPDTKGCALDVGAGRGISSYALIKSGWQVTALEPDPSHLVGAGAIRSLNDLEDLNIKIVETWGETLPFEDSSFDLVFCRAVLHHANDLKAFCMEVNRVLKPEGVFLAIREHVISRKEDLPSFLESHPLHHLYGGEHAYLLHEYQKAMSQGELKLCKTINPLASDINTFPQSLDEIKKHLAAKLYLPACMIPQWLLRLKGAMSHTPGRLYSFMAVKV